MKIKWDISENTWLAFGTECKLGKCQPRPLFPSSWSELEARAPVPSLRLWAMYPQLSLPSYLFLLLELHPANPLPPQPGLASATGLTLRQNRESFQYLEFHIPQGIRNLQLPGIRGKASGEEDSCQTLLHPVNNHGVK